MVSKAINLAMRGFEVCFSYLSRLYRTGSNIVAQFFWALLIMALVGNMIATSYAGNPSIINYDMFLAVFAMLSLLYLIPATIKEGFQGHPLLMVALDALNAIFFFCGAVAMAAYLRVHSCSNSVSLIHRLCCFSFLTSHPELHHYQLHHERLRQHQEALPRGSGHHCIPLVRLCCLHRLCRPFRTAVPRFRHDHARRCRWYQEGSLHEPGLNASPWIPRNVFPTQPLMHRCCVATGWTSRLLTHVELHLNTSRRY